MPDVAGNTSSLVDLAIGLFQDSDIESANEDDFFRVNLTALRTYTFRAIGAGTGTFTLADPVIEGLYRTGNVYVPATPSATVVTFNNDGLISGPNRRDAMITYSVPSGQGGYYWVSVSGDLRTLGTYRVTLTDSTGNGDNSNNTRATAATINVGGSVAIGSIDSESDAAWYKVGLTAGITYTIRMRGLTNDFGTLPDPVITGVYDRNGNYLTNTYIDDFETRDAILTFVAPATDEFYIAAEGWSTYTGTFQLDINEATADIPGNTSSTASLNIGESTTARMEQPYDHDWYAVSLVAGRTYQFSLYGTGSNNTPGIHGVFNSSGVYVGGYAAPVLGTATATAASSFTPTTSGTYYVDAFSLYQGTYTLSAAQITDDVPNNRFTTASVAVGGSVMGEIGGATDIDWYSVTLDANNNYAIRIRGRQSNAGSLDDPLIAGIYDANGVLVRGTFSDDSDGNEPSLVFRPPSSGTYYIAADGFTSYTGTYNLSVTLLGTDVGQTTASAQAVSLNTPTVVTIDDSADADWYSISLTGGVTYGIRLQGAATKRGTIYDPILMGVYDSSGSGERLVDTFVDDARGLLNSYLSFTAPHPGSHTYYIAAEGYDRFTGTMKLAVTIDDDVTPRTLLVGTAAEGTIDTGIDVDRYTVTLAASTTYYIRMLGLDLRNGDLADPNISAILDPNNGTSLFTSSPINDPASTPSPAVGRDAWVKLTTTAAGAGVYKIDAASSLSTDGAFLLTIDTDVPNTTSTTQTLTVDGPALTGMIDEGTDADWFRVTLPSTTTSYVIKMLGVHTGNGTLADPRINGLYLWNSGTGTTSLVTNTNTTGVDNAVGRDSVVKIIPGAANSVYYINASSSGANVGSFRISAAVEVGQSNATSAPLSIGQSVVGTIDDAPDADWYKVTLTANAAYVFKLSGVDGGGGTLDFPQIVNIYNPTGTGQSGTANWVSSTVGTDVVIRWIPGTSNDYYINVQGGGTDVGTFTLSAASEIGGTLNTAGAITPGGAPVTGIIDDYTDSDLYRFSHSGTVSYLIRMRGVDSGGGTLADPHINGILTTGLASAGGSVTSLSNGRDAIYLWSPSSSTAADYLIDARSASNTVGTFQLSIVVEEGSSAATATTLAVGGSISGTVNVNGESDWYKFSHASSTGYVIRMRGAGSGGGTLAAPDIVAVRNASGTAQAVGFIEVADGSDAVVRWSPESATIPTDYYIDVSGAGEGTYTVSIATEAGHTAQGAWSVNVGSSATGTIDDGTDSDFYKFSHGATNTGYLIRMRGADSGNGTLANPEIVAVLNGSGVSQSGGFITVSNNQDHVIRWSPTTAGAADYYIDTQGAGTTGTFNISVETEVGHTAAGAPTLTIGGSLPGTIDDATDADWYKVTLATTSSYVFRMKGSYSSNGTLGDPHLPGILDANGAAVAGEVFSSNGTDANIRFVPAAGATYHIDAQGNGTTGTYVISAEIEAGNTTATDLSLTLGNSTTAEITDTSDIDWYNVTGFTTGRSYVFKVLGSASGNGTLADPHMPSLLTSGGADTVTGEIIGTGVGNDAVIRWVANATTWPTIILAASGNASSTGSYVISAAWEAGDATGGSSMPVTVGSTTNGAIDDSADIDRYSITLVAGTRYRIQMLGNDSNGTLSLIDPHVTLRLASAPTGTVVAQDAGFGGGNRDVLIDHTPSGTAGTNVAYLIDADNSAASNPTVIGSYQLIVTTW